MVAEIFENFPTEMSKNALKISTHGSEQVQKKIQQIPWEYKNKSSKIPYFVHDILYTHMLGTFWY